MQRARRKSSPAASATPRSSTRESPRPSRVRCAVENEPPASPPQSRHHEAFLRVLELADLAPESVIEPWQLLSFGGGWREHLASRELLRREGFATRILCEDSGEMVELDEAVECGEDRVQVVARGWTESGYQSARVPRDRVQLWKVSLAGVAKALAAAIDARLSATTVIEDRLVALGRTSRLGPPTTLFVARGVAWPDAARVVGRHAAVSGSERPVVITIGRTPEPACWSLELPPVVRLRECARLTDDGLLVDFSPLASAAERAGPRWLTQQEAVELLAKDFHRDDRKRLTAWVSTAGSRREFRTNGLERGDKLIDPITFDVWRLRKRDEELDRDDRT